MEDATNLVDECPGSMLAQQIHSTEYKIARAARLIIPEADEFELWRRIAKSAYTLAIDSTSKASERLIAVRFLAQAGGVAPCPFCGQ